MKRDFSWTKAQQAPASWQARLFGADHTASTRAQRMSGGIATARKAAARIVKIVLETLLNRLARNQPNGPETARGGGSATSGRSCVASVIRQRSTSATA